MFKNVFTKTLYSQRWQLLGWSLAVFLIAFLTMVLYTSFSQAGIEDVVNSVPDSLKSLVGNVADFKTIPGYIGQQIFGPNLYIFALIMGVLMFISISASEEDDGRLQSLLSFPVSRTRVYFQKLLATSFYVALISASTFIALGLALVILGETANYTRVWLSILDLFLITLAYGLITYASAMATGKKGLTILLASGYTVASFLITSLAPAVDKLSIVDKFSLLHYYNNPQIMSQGLNLKHIWVLLAAIVILTLIGWLGFLRRDIRAS